MYSYSEPDSKSHAEAMSALHAVMHPYCGCIGVNAVHMCCPSCPFRHVCTKDGHFCVQDFFQTIIELDLTYVNL